jgi:hypothetical protein
MSTISKAYDSNISKGISQIFPKQNNDKSPSIRLTGNLIGDEEVDMKDMIPTDRSIEQDNYKQNLKSKLFQKFGDIKQEI